MDSISVVNLLHTDGREFHPINFCIYVPDCDGKTKNDHILEKLHRARGDRIV